MPLKRKFLFYMIFGGLIVGLFFCLITYKRTPNPIDSHNCRFWAIIFSGTGPALDTVIRTHLDSLRSLGNGNNPDGWGIGFYTSLGATVPVISRGEPQANTDPRYDKIVDEIADYIAGAGIAHVRKATSGVGLPDPHPFRRWGVNRNFEMLFAHNGSIPTDVLLNLINAVDPTYLNSNPPDYIPYIDSDLFSLYIMEMLDEYVDSTVEKCIKIAIAKLDSALGVTPARLNFVMTNGVILWALRFADTLATSRYTLYYYPDSGVSNMWVAASEPLDTHTVWWTAVPNFTLVTLQPNQLPQFTGIYSNIDVDFYDQINNTPGLNHPNPFSKEIKISYHVYKTSEIDIAIYNETGSLVRRLFKGKQKPGSYTFIWNGEDDQGKKLPSGNYFCKIGQGNTFYPRKIVLVK